MALHSCSCDAASCNATLCAAQRMNVWTSDCPNHCNTNECGKEPEQKSDGDDKTGGGDGGNGNEGNSNSTSDGDVVVADGDSVDDPLEVSSSTTSLLSQRNDTVLVRVVLLLSQLYTVGIYL
mmetsp:Transcript_54143/g.60458  ORF Transcript_54143/g.60458 Transcript_54143/m.60458 type:complete len:122 (-) Transcript_54143:20-385(-)